MFGYFKKFLLQKKKFFAVLVEVDPLKKKKVSGKYYGIRMKKAHGVHKTWVVAPVAPMQELWKGGVEMCGGYLCTHGGLRFRDPRWSVFKMIPR